jgi:hypothetical protein
MGHQGVACHPGVDLPRTTKINRTHQAHGGQTGWILACCCVYVLTELSVSAQFMRLGPFDVDAGMSFQGVYSTNVEFERESEANLDREDYYLVYKLDVSMLGPTTPTSELNVSSGLTIEKHFERDDLDNVTDPFGLLDLTHDLELGRFVLPTVIQFRRENTEEQDETTRIFIPGQRKQRVVQDTRLFSQGLNWERDPLSLISSYSFQQIRFDDEEFQDGDEDKETYNFGADWNIIQWGGQDRLNTFYTYDRSRTELKNKADDDRTSRWETDQAVGLRFAILTRPAFNYTWAYRKADQEDWRQTHTFDLSDEWELSPTMQADAQASYTIDEEPRDDDVLFTYSAGINHDIGRTLNHNFRMTRQPVDTFGSTQDTDSTTYAYNLTKTDLFFADVTFNGNVTYSIDKPQAVEGEESEEERILRYSVTLSHQQQLSRRLSRTFQYLYQYEKDEDIPESIEEHRIILSFDFSF